MNPRLWTFMLLASALGGCGIMPDWMFASRNSNVQMVDGPPIEDIVTQFDEALNCLRGSVPRGIIFAVGQVVDSTGRESYADGATGRFVTQGAGEIVQSALFRSGVSVVNRRDPNITVTETQWGIRDIQLQIPVNFYISGSINSLDFIPGGGIELQIAGVGPRYRQTRILIGLDLTMTDAFTGRIVASVPLQRQIFSTEMGGSIGRFFNTTLVTLDAGRQEREAVHFILRQMLSLATFELLSQVANDGQHSYCRTLVDPFYGNLSAAERGDDFALQEALSVAEQVAARRRTTQEEQSAAQQQAAEAQNAARAAQSLDGQVRNLSSQASIFAARAIAAAEESLAADSNEVAAQKAAEAMQLMAGSVQILRRAAEMGLSGPEGDAVAVVVERAVIVTQQAAEAVAARSQTAPDLPGVATPPPPAPRAQPIPGTPDAARQGG